MASKKQVKVGNIFMGGGSPVTVQSMLSVPAHNFSGNVEQAKRLYNAGCEIIRVSVPDKDTVPLIPLLKQAVPVPIVADIHFDYRLAIESVAAGVDKVRINPGNIGDDQKVKQVANCCKTAGVPIRIGVNSGSLEKDILAKFGGVTPEAIVQSGLYHISLLERFDFDDIVLSLKSSDVNEAFAAYTLASQKCPYPLHLGITEAGVEKIGIVRSACGVGGLLLSGIGDTIRVSLTDDPVKEVAAGIEILKAVGLRNDGIKFISCPTCGRTKIDLIGLANAARERLCDVKKDITVAIMGCVVNGPGEASRADIGIAGGEGCGLIFKKGQKPRKVKEENLLDELVKEIERM